jgi:phosphonate transport system substrate-binding protein
MSNRSLSTDKKFVYFFKCIFSFLKKQTVFIGFILLVFNLNSCNRKPKDSGPEYGTVPLTRNLTHYTFAVHPLHNPEMLFKTYVPVIDYINEGLEGASLTLEASRDYNAFEDKYKKRTPDFILPNPWQTIQAMKYGYHVIAMAGEASDFKGIFIIPVQSDIKTPKDLKGKAVSYPASTALAACIMPQYFLFKHGVNVNQDIDNKYVGSQESSIMNVFLGKTAAGVTWPPPWRAFERKHPEEASKLKVIWETEPLINNSIMVRNDIPVEIELRVLSILSGIHKTDKGRTLLQNIETSGFYPANDSTYGIVEKYISRFEKEVRKIDRK